MAVSTAAPPTTTRAVVHDRYGPAEVLRVREIELPPLEPEQVLVRVRATSVNPADWYGVSGPWFARAAGGWRRPKDPRSGIDLAGLVVAAGSGVTWARVGEEVFGTGIGAWGEYAVAREERLAPKPAGVSFEDAAAVPIAAITALQALRHKAGVSRGERVLVNGASGGVGTYAVQLAKWLGADVTAVCSTRNVEQARDLGADRVVDYRQEDFCRRPERHDVVVDIAGSRPLRHLRRVLTRDARVILVGAPMSARGLGPLGHLIGTKLAGLVRPQSVTFFVAKINTADLALVGELLEAGTVRSVIERRYEGLEEVATALGHLGAKHARGKIVIAI